MRMAYACAFAYANGLRQWLMLLLGYGLDNYGLDTAWAPLGRLCSGRRLETAWTLKALTPV